MKTTHRRTLFVFRTEDRQRAAIDFLLALNMPFQANLKYPYFVSVTTKRATQQPLDLYLDSDNTFSTFKTV